MPSCRLVLGTDQWHPVAAQGVQCAMKLEACWRQVTYSQLHWVPACSLGPLADSPWVWEVPWTAAAQPSSLGRPASNVQDMGLVNDKHNEILWRACRRASLMVSRSHGSHVRHVAQARANDHML